MSDNIANDQNYAVFFNSTLRSSNGPSFGRHPTKLGCRKSFFEKEIQEKSFNLHEGPGRYNNQFERRITKPDDVLNDRHNFSGASEDSYIEELQRLSAILIQLLSQTRQKTSKVKESCGVSHRFLAEQKCKHQNEATLSLCNSNNKQFQPQLTNRSPQNGSLAEVKMVREQPNGASIDTNSVEKPAFQNVVTTTCPFSSADKKLRTCELPEDISTVQYKDTPKCENEKDRHKKEVHNKIERKRRSFINERINELGSLLPQQIDRASCQKKGSILKESIDSIKKLQQDQNRVDRLENTMSKFCLEVKTLANRLKQLEYRLENLHADSGGTVQLPCRTPDKPKTECIFTDSSVKVPAGAGRHQVSLMYQENRPNVLTTMTDMVQADNIWEDFYTTLSVDSVYVVSHSSEMDTGNIYCNI